MSPEVSAGRLQNFRTTLLKWVQAEPAEAELAAEKPDSSTPSVAIGRTASPATPTTHKHGSCDGDGADTGDVQQDGVATPASSFSMRAATVAKCEALSAFCAGLHTG